MVVKENLKKDFSLEVNNMSQQLLIVSLKKKREWLLKESEDFLNNSAFSMMQFKRDADAITEQIRSLENVSTIT